MKYPFRFEFLHFSPQIVLRIAFLSVIFPLLTSSPCLAQISEDTNNQSEGTSSSFTIKVMSTHGVQTNTSRTRDMNVEATGTLIVGPDSTSIQQNDDGSLGFISQADGTAQGQTQGVAGFQRINFGEGTRYDVKITTLDNELVCPTGGDIQCTIPDVGSASGTVLGQTSTTLTVDATQSSFVNSFIRSFQAQ